MKYHDKQCQRCNKKYVGTASSKYCIDCKDEVAQERARENSRKQRAKRV